MSTKGSADKPFTKDERLMIRKYIRSMNLPLKEANKRLKKLAKYDSPRSVSTSRKSLVNKGHLIHGLFSPSRFSDKTETTQQIFRSIAARETRRGEPGNIKVPSLMGRRGGRRRCLTQRSRRQAQLEKPASFLGRFTIQKFHCAIQC